MQSIFYIEKKLSISKKQHNFLSIEANSNNQKQIQKNKILSNVKRKIILAKKDEQVYLKLVKMLNYSQNLLNHLQ